MVTVRALELAGLGAQPAQTRSLMLLLGATAFTAIAVLGSQLNGIRRRGAPGARARYRPSQRPRTYTSLLMIATLLSGAAFVAAVGLPLDHAVPVQEPASASVISPIDLPAASAVGPGAGIYVEYADGSGGMGCTAGFLVRTSTGRPAVLTAGHCNRPGEPSTVSMNLAGILPYTTLGTFAQTVNEGVHTEQHDIGLIALDRDTVPRDPAIAASLPVSGVTDNLNLGQQLCKFGMGSGEAACGQVVEISDSQVVFLATGRCGDSGGPVYLVQGDGSASAVGILTRGGDLNSPKAGCSAPAKFSVAELIQPWLDKWELTAVTTPAR